MNEKAVVEAYRAFIVSKESTIVEGITFQGQPKAFHQVVGTNLTPPTGYLYILVICLGGPERSQPVTNMQRPTRMTAYRMRIEITDQALYTQGETSPYSQMHDDFRLIVDRIADLIEKENWIGTTPKVRLQRQEGEGDRQIEKLNLSGIWQDARNVSWATLHSQLNFTAEGYVDTTVGLYP